MAKPVLVEVEYLGRERITLLGYTFIPRGPCQAVPWEIWRLYLAGSPLFKLAGLSTSKGRVPEGEVPLEWRKPTRDLATEIHIHHHYRDRGLNVKELRLVIDELLRAMIKFERKREEIVGMRTGAGIEAETELQSSPKFINRDFEFEFEFESELPLPDLKEFSRLEASFEDGELGVEAEEEK